MCLSSLCLAFCVFLPGSLSIRAMNDEAYATMTKYAAEHGLPSGGRQTGTDLFQYRSDEENLSAAVAGANEGEGAEEAREASMLTDAEDLPRDAALVTGTSSLTSYFPTLLCGDADAFPASDIRPTGLQRMEREVQKTQTGSSRRRFFSPVLRRIMRSRAEAQRSIRRQFRRFAEM